MIEEQPENVAVDLTKTKLREFLFRFFRQHTLQDHEDVFALGFVNSLFAMQLVTFVEKEFSIAIQDEDLDLDNFRSINAIAGLIKTKYQADTINPGS